MGSSEKEARESARRLLFSAGEKPYLALRLKKNDDVLLLGRRLVTEYAQTAESESSPDRS